MTIQKVLSSNKSLLIRHHVNKNHIICAFSTKSPNNDYQYIQKGQIPMLHFQRSLPRLPIPKLEMTCTRFLAAVQPLISESSHQELNKMIERFCTIGNGQSLQKLLIEHDRANKHTSYISEPWFDMYLSDRRPLPINYNPLLMMKRDIKPAYNDQLLRTANLVVSSLRFMRSLRDEILEPEIYHLNPKKSDTPRFKNIIKRTPTLISTFVAYAFKAFPLDMSQYQGLFGATRIPEIGKDRIYRKPTTTHICVMRNGHIYAVNVLDTDGNIIPPSKIISRLKFILQDPSAQSDAEYPLGVLTASNRDKWATVRQHLVEIGNEKSLDVVDSALFCVSVDDHTSYSDDNPLPIVQNQLHGDNRGLKNRWFDKSLSLIVAKDGTTGINFEHSWGDGVAVLRLFNEIYKEISESPIVHPTDVNNVGIEDVSENVFRVELNLDEKARHDITEAVNTYQTTVNSLQMHYMKYFDMNKVTCKKHRVSPDAIMQLGFQLAYLKQHGEYVGAYESCSTAAFRHGRTETVRPVTLISKSFCDAIQSKSLSLSTSDLRNLIVKCSTRHGELIKEAAMGQGFDRHLFGLKHIAQLNKISVDPIYEHEAYKKINCNILSSSTLTSVGLLAGAFGPVEQNGYGIGYNIQEEFLGTIVTSYKGQRNGSEFIDCLKEAYEDIRKILESE